MGQFKMEHTDFIFVILTLERKFIHALVLILKETTVIYLLQETSWKESELSET